MVCNNSNRCWVGARFPLRPTGKPTTAKLAPTTLPPECPKLAVARSDALQPQRLCVRQHEATGKPRPAIIVTADVFATLPANAKGGSDLLGRLVARTRVMTCLPGRSFPTESANNEHHTKSACRITCIGINEDVGYARAPRSPRPGAASA